MNSIEWVKTSERRPEKHGSYLVCDGTDGISVYVLTQYGWGARGDDHGRIDPEYWSELPSPPEELLEARRAYERQELEDKQAAERAKMKLTPKECKLLGVKP